MGRIVWTGAGRPLRPESGSGHGRWFQRCGRQAGEAPAPAGDHWIRAPIKSRSDSGEKTPRVAYPDKDARCPCLSGETYGACCGRYLESDAAPPTAESLMRSRFTAFAVGDAAYLLLSWHGGSRPDSFELDQTLRWYRLDILSTTAGGPLDTEGAVEFRAYFKHDDGAGSQRERSRFVRTGGRWFYLDGVVDS
ncbi:YchJ family protein [Paeniglutamicibacter antarcticus]|uniref:UPF0225 protein IV500_16415 n=1 Tax=Arthrobacter terrae TaxID=2935737 RepID=A0A931CQ29_9MICC|nr:YchJ family protein [Arthrobacter terrae]MBG0740957.1 YchJ family protein [Arthrobacter terrae]